MTAPWIDPEAAALFTSLPDHDLRVYLRDCLCASAGPPPYDGSMLYIDRMHGLRDLPAPGSLPRLSFLNQRWVAHTPRSPQYMVDPGDAIYCKDYQVEGASACRTERAALELWCLYFWCAP